MTARTGSAMTAIAVAAIVAVRVAAQPGAAEPGAAAPGAMMRGMAADAPCPATPASLPPALAGWSARQALTAASGLPGLARATLAPGRSAVVRLLATPAVAYPVAPGHAGDGAGHGGLLGFAVATPGTYRVALDAAAWIDVVAVPAGGPPTALASTAHGKGPACSGIRKIVDFALAPGRYTLQIAAAAAPTLTVLIVRAP